MSLITAFNDSFSNSFVIIYHVKISYSFKSIDILKNLAKFTGKHLCQSLFFNKVAGVGTLAQLFSFNFTKFLTTHILQNISRQLFLNRIVIQTRRVQFFHGCNLRVKFFTSFTENLTNF